MSALALPGVIESGCDEDAGKKTDVCDAQWLQHLHADGVLRRALPDREDWGDGGRFVIPVWALMNGGQSAGSALRLALARLLRQISSGWGASTGIRRPGRILSARAAAGLRRGWSHTPCAGLFWTEDFWRK